MNMKKLLYIIGLLLLISCSESNKKKEKIQLLNYTVLIDDEALNNPYLISVTDDFLFLANKKTDTIIETFSLNGEKISQFLLHGEGADEALNVVGLQYIAKDKALHIVDNFRSLTYSVSLLDVGEDVVKINKEPIDLSNIDEKLAVRDWWYFLSNGNFISSSASPQGMLSYYDMSKEKFNFYEKYPDFKLINDELNESAAIELFQSCCSVTPEGDKAAIVYYGSDIIGFITLNSDGLGTNFIVSQLPNDIYPIHLENGITRGAYTGKSLRHYVNVTTNKSNVYALYCGLPEEKCAPGLMRGKWVRCYDWEGKLLHTIDLGLEVLKISVSADNKYLYALESSENGFRVLRYEL